MKKSVKEGIAMILSVVAMGMSIISCGKNGGSELTDNGGTGVPTEPDVPIHAEPEHEHEMKHVEGKEAGCESGGYSEYWYCDGCGKIFDKDGNETEIQIIDAKGHEYEDTVIEVTCTTDGYTEHKCKSCGNTYRDDRIAASGHEYGDGETIKESECDTDGIRKYVCGKCGDEKTEIIEKKGHRYEATEVKATCTASGYIKYICKDCGNEYTEEKEEARGHDYIQTTVDATCDSDGFTEYECSICGDKYTEKTEDAKGHEYATVVVAPTCTEHGYTVYECERCGDTYTDDITEAAGHVWKESAVIIEATCEHCGEVEYVCEACGAEKTETTAKKAHGYGSEWKFDATYHWHEASCECEFGDKAVHDIENGKCKICGYEEESLEYEDNGDGTLTVKGIGTVTDREIEIPSEYGGKKVTRIADGAFMNDKSIMGVKIGANVIYIGKEAFYGCTGIRSMEFAEKSGWYCMRSADASTGTKLTVTNNTYLELVGIKGRMYFLRKENASC